MKSHDPLLIVNEIPRKMIELHNNSLDDRLAEFVLHDLCSHSCFKLEKAAFLIENPDFHCVKGVVGVNSAECVQHDFVSNVWQKPHDFTKFMEQSTFNNQVRSITHERSANELTDTIIYQEFAPQLSLHNPCCIRWHMKHGNGGILLFDDTHHLSEESKKKLAQSLYLLSLCPVH